MQEPRSLYAGAGTVWAQRYMLGLSRLTGMRWCVACSITYAMPISVRSEYAPPLTDTFSVRRVVVLYPIGMVTCGWPACGRLGTEPRIAMKSSLGSDGVSLLSMSSIALCHAALRSGRFARYAVSFAPPGVTSDSDELT